MTDNELAFVIVMNTPFGEYSEIFDDDGNVTLAYNRDYKSILLEEIRILKNAYEGNLVST